jgi:hypothetical protein
MFVLDTPEISLSRLHLRFAIRLLRFILISLLATVSLLSAQDASTGARSGTVIDPDGGRIAAASIRRSECRHRVRYLADTDNQGRFVIQLLPPGDYSARAEAPGMSPELSPKIHVDVGGSTELEFRLRVAGSKETVNVSDTPALVETQPSAVSTVIDERAILYTTPPDKFPRHLRQCRLLFHVAVLVLHHLSISSVHRPACEAYPSTLRH